MNKITDIFARINPEPVAFFDKVAIRIANKLSDSWIAELRANSNFVKQEIGHHIISCDKKWILTIIAPKQSALEFLSRRIVGFVNYAEVALDLDTPNEDDARELAQIFDKHFVQSRHQQKQSVKFRATSYTGKRKPGHNFCWYPDKVSKVTGAVHTFHIEGRHQGVESVRRLGIEKISDFLKFDFRQYWEKYLKMYQVDFERLGRLHFNRLESRKRQSPRISDSGGYKYNVDTATGRVLFRIYGTDNINEIHSVQSFVDQAGRGPFLHQVDVSQLLPP